MLRSMAMGSVAMPSTKVASSRAMSRIGSVRWWLPTSTAHRMISVDSVRAAVRSDYVFNCGSALRRTRSTRCTPMQVRLPAVGAFNGYLADDDFVGADMAPKFFQMG